MENNTKKCPKCMTEIDKKASVCPNCKADLRNWFVKHWIISIFLFIFIGIPFITGILEGITSSNEIVKQVEQEIIEEKQIEKEKIEEAKLTPEQLLDKQISITNKAIENNLKGFTLNEIKDILDKNNNFIDKYIDLEKSKELKEKSSNLNTIYSEMTIELNSKWLYSDSKDEMDGVQSFYASNISTNTFDLTWPYKETGAMLTIRKIGNKSSEVMFRVDSGQILDYNKTARIKFDDEQPIVVSITGTSDGSSDVVFFGKVYTIISKLKTAKKVMIELEFYQDGDKIARFDVEGFKWDK